jgi:DNA-directed RNA polymerase specialized sigma24 family protein
MVDGIARAWEYKKNYSEKQSLYPYNATVITNSFYSRV